MTQQKQTERTQKTRARICSAFIGLLSERPIQAITIKALCQQAGVNRGTFYAHYQDIFDLMKTIEDDVRQSIQQTLNPLMENGSPASQLEILQEIFLWLKDNRDMCALILRPSGDRYFLFEILQMGRVVCQESSITSFQQIPPQAMEWFYRFVSGGFIALLGYWLEEDMRTPAESMAKTAFDLIMHSAEALREP